MKILPIIFSFLGLVCGNGFEEHFFPLGLRGTWFSWERGQNEQHIIGKNYVHPWGTPRSHFFRRYDRHHYLFKPLDQCFTCLTFIIRSWNIVERIDSPCIDSNFTQIMENFKKVGCHYLLKDRIELPEPENKTSVGIERGVYMYRESASPVNCRHAVYGNFKFAYQVTDSFTGECDHHDSRLQSCEIAGSQFFISNQKFILRFRQCEGIRNSFTSLGEFVCLGEWREGLQQFFVAANLRESRKEERYRCFLKNREDPHYIGMSRSPSCRMLKTPENSPIRLRITPLQKLVQPSCFFPGNISGRWISSGRGEPSVVINKTHIVESRWVGHQLRNDINVCIQSKGKRFLLAKVSEFGCQTEYVCWEIVPRHHNIVRFRKSRALIKNTFEVCDYGNFQNKQHWKYDTLISEESIPVQCPFSGRFSFGQKGSVPLRERIPNGITRSPLDTYQCLTRETELSVCDAERKHIIIDLDHCMTLNRDGHPVEINTISDYHLNCVGFWKENLLSYLVTHDPFDSVSKFRCWVYQRVSLTEMRLSQGLGSSCGLHQMFTSATVEDGATLALNLTLKERLYDQCPMYYDDGSQPWKDYDGTLKVFSFKSSSSRRKPHLFIRVFIFSNILCTQVVLSTSSLLGVHANMF